MAPDHVRQVAQLGSARGWELFVMYGQTEATSRIAYLPPHLAHDHPGAIGVPIPGGSLTVREEPDPAGAGIGELIYRGPNVMLGYATDPRDLSLGRTVDELATGDLGRVNSAGLFEIVGRKSRFVKITGLRLDLDEVERIASACAGEALCAGDDERLVVAITARTAAHHLAAELAQQLAIPRRAVDLQVHDELPRLTNGKPDYAALTSPRSSAAARARNPMRRRRHTRRDGSVHAILADVVGRESTGGRDTFVSLGGDSLSYVEASVRLEELLGFVPRDWHVTPIAELATLHPCRRRLASVETTIVLRALSIVAVVANHMKVFVSPGGAHILLAVVGFNFARFQLAAASMRELLRRSWATAARVAVPTSLWIGVQMATVGGYSIGALLLVNNYTGSSWRREGRWQYWFFEAFVQIFLAATLLLAIPLVRRTERRHQFAFAFTLLLAALLLRFEVVRFGDPYNALFRPHTVVWFFLIGWAAERSRSTLERCAVTAVVLAAVPGFFDAGQRELTVIVGLVVLTWVPRLSIPKPLHRLVGVVAAASMYIFLVHWQVWPPLRRLFVGHVALALTIACGIATWMLVEQARRAWRSRHDGANTDTGELTVSITGAPGAGRRAECSLAVTSVESDNLTRTSPS
jgi:peptidoglycan/LPS O-acetylase OafA/YrhL